MILKKRSNCANEAEFFSELARECNTAIAAGIHVEEEGRHYDAACLFDETGTSGRVSENPSMG